MHREIVVAVMGEDQPGLIETLSDCLQAYEANWTESRLASLGTQFSGMFCARVPERQAHSLAQALEALSTPRLRVHVGATSKDSSERLHKFELTCTGIDRTGIVHDITRALSDFGVHIDEFETRARKGEWVNGGTFDVRAMLSAAQPVNVQALRHAVEAAYPGMLVVVHAFTPPVPIPVAEAS